MPQAVCSGLHGMQPDEDQRQIMAFLDLQAPGSAKKGSSDFVNFTDASERTRLSAGTASDAQHSVLAVADRDGVGNLYTYVSFTSGNGTN